jgi:large subunit ribosomal protein L10
MPRPEKVNSVNKVKESLENSKSVFVTDYTGLNVEQITELRKKLRDNNIKYLVAKNTLMRIAFKEAGREKLLDYLKGQTALAFGADDPVVAAKILYDSYKEIEKPEIRAFTLQDDFFEGREITRLADLPSREELLAQVIMAVESPITSTIGMIDAVFRELVATIDAVAASKQ